MNSLSRVDVVPCQIIYIFYLCAHCIVFQIETTPMAVNDKDVLDNERDIWKQYIIGQAKDTNDTMKVVIILHCAYCRGFTL